MTAPLCRLLSVAVVLAELTACRPAPAPPPATARARRAIEAALHRYVDATNTGDIAALTELYAEDAVLLPPDHGLVSGREAIREFWLQGTDHGLVVTTLRVDVQGDLGYLIGQYTLPPSEQEPADSGKYLMCLRRQRDGSWKVTADIWNSSVPAEEGTSGQEEPSPRWQVS